MSTIGGYTTRQFSETQKFLVLDPSTQSTSLVSGSSLIEYIQPRLNSVIAESTRVAAQNTDYKVGSIIQTSGATAPGDNFASTYLVVEGGAGDFPMLNGNDLLVLLGDDNLRDDLLSEDAGKGASLVSMEGGPSVEEAVNQRVIRVSSRTEMKAYDVPTGYQFSLEEGGRSGTFIRRSGTPPVSDPEEGVFVIKDGSFYDERINLDKLTPEMFGASGDDSTDDTTAISAAINMASSLKLKLWITNRHIVTGTLPFPGYTHIVAMPWARILGNFAGPMFLDPNYESAAGNSYGQVVEHLVASNQGGDVYHVQTRNMKISYGQVSAATGYGVKMSSASDQAFENYFDHILFKGCKYPIWSRGNTVDPVTADPAYSFSNTDCWMTNCIIDGYAGASIVMDYSYIGNASGWFFRNNHWYGSNATKFLAVRGINVSIADYFERNGTDYAVEVLSGNPSSYNFSGTTFWLSAGGKGVLFSQGSFHVVNINFGGATVTGGDSSSYLIDATYTRSGSSASNCVIEMSGASVPRDVNYATDTRRVFGVNRIVYKEDNSGGPVSWNDIDWHETNIYNKVDAFAATLTVSGLPTEHTGKRVWIYNASTAQSITLSAGAATVIRPDGTTASGYVIPARTSILFIEDGGDYRIVEN